MISFFCFRNASAVESVSGTVPRSDDSSFFEYLSLQTVSESIGYSFIRLIRVFVAYPFSTTDVRLKCRQDFFFEELLYRTFKCLGTVVIIRVRYK